MRRSVVFWGTLAIGLVAACVAWGVVDLVLVPRHRTAAWASAGELATRHATPSEWAAWTDGVDDFRPFSVLGKGGSYQLGDSRFLITDCDGGPYWGNSWTPGSSRILTVLPEGDWVMFDDGNGAKPIEDRVPLPADSPSPCWVLVRSSGRISVVAMKPLRRFVWPRVR